MTVHSFSVQRSAASAQDLDFNISCSKGTYIRSLAHDLVSCVCPETYGLTAISQCATLLIGPHAIRMSQRCLVTLYSTSNR